MKVLKEIVVHQRRFTDNSKFSKGAECEQYHLYET